MSTSTTRPATAGSTKARTAGAVGAGRPNRCDAILQLIDAALADYDQADEARPAAARAA